MSERTKAKLIERTTIEIEQGGAGLFYAMSPDMPGLLVAENSPEECWARLPQAIADLRALSPQDYARGQRPASGVPLPQPLDASDIPPLATALMDALPPSGSTWPTHKQEAFLKAAEAIFDLLYEDESVTARLRRDWHERMGAGND